jgi:hypothetical protein
VSSVSATGPDAAAAVARALLDLAPLTDREVSRIAALLSLPVPDPGGAP